MIKENHQRKEGIKVRYFQLLTDWLGQWQWSLTAKKCPSCQPLLHKQWNTQQRGSEAIEWTHVEVGLSKMPWHLPWQMLYWCCSFFLSSSPSFFPHAVTHIHWLHKNPENMPPNGWWLSLCQTRKKPEIDQVINLVLIYNWGDMKIL